MRHNIYIRKENEEIWQSIQDKSAFVNAELSKIANNSEPYAKVSIVSNRRIIHLIRRWKNDPKNDVMVEVDKLVSSAKDMFKRTK